MTGDNVNPRNNWAVQNHAIYSFDAVKHQEYIELQPLALPFEHFRVGYSYHNNLRVTTMPSCTVEIADRCLLVLTSHQNPVRIVYSYTIESAGHPGHGSVRFELTHKVEISGTPLKYSGEWDEGLPGNLLSDRQKPDSLAPIAANSPGDLLYPFACLLAASSAPAAIAISAPALLPLSLDLALKRLLLALS